MNKNNVPIIAIANQKGGVGKTTTTFNMGAALAGHLLCPNIPESRNVLLIDLDPQGNLTKTFLRDQEIPSATSADIFQAGRELPAIIASYKSNLYLLPADRGLSREAETIANDFDRINLLKVYIAKLEKISLVMIDTPPTLGGLTTAALIAATHLLIPISTHLYSLQGTKDLLDTYRRVKERLNPTVEIVGVLLSDYDQRTALANEIAEKVTEIFHGKLFKTKIMHSVKIEEAAVKRQAIIDQPRQSEAADAYKQLAAEVMERLGMREKPAEAPQ